MAIVAPLAKGCQVQKITSFWPMVKHVGYCQDDLASRNRMPGW